MKYSNIEDVKVGDKIRGFGVLRCQGNFGIDRSPIVTVREHNGRLYAGSLSFPESFDKIIIEGKLFGNT